MGSGNPPDKPGYKVVTLPADDEKASEILTQAHDDGFEVVTMFVSVNGTARVVLENYSKTNA